LRISLFDDNDLFRFDYFRFYFLLFARFQVAGILCLLSHALHCIHHIRLLRQESIPEVRGPLDVIGQAFHQIGKRRHGLYTRIPRLLLHGIDERFVFQSLVFFQPLLELNEFQGVGGSG
jgi:hypothetical protein